MIIIGFSKKSSLVLPKILCRNFKHCVVIVPHKNNLIMYQFVRRGNVANINISNQSIGQLRRFGWTFIYLPYDIAHNFNPYSARTCVDMAKSALKIKNIFIQTPDSLYRHII